MSTIRLVKTTIRVTAQDIAKGTPFRPSICAVARAISRHLKPGYRVSCGSPSISIGPAGAPHAWKDNEGLRGKPVDVIRDFDAGTAKPTSFTLKLPKRFLRT